jgi:2Fe-2S ferredoxin
MHRSGDAPMLFSGRSYYNFCSIVQITFAIINASVAGDFLGKSNYVPGIDGDCGGNAACAMGHVFVDLGWIARIGDRCEQERGLLELAEGTRDNSRLAYQIALNHETDGLVLKMPEAQF